MTPAELTETFMRDVLETGRARGLTHYAVAERAGMGSCEVSKLTHGARSSERGPMLRTLCRLAAAVDCELVISLVPSRRRGVR